MSVPKLDTRVGVEPTTGLCQDASDLYTTRLCQLVHLVQRSWVEKSLTLVKRASPPNQSPVKPIIPYLKWKVKRGTKRGKKEAPSARLELATPWLSHNIITARCSTIELRRNEILLTPLTSTVRTFLIRTPWIGNMFFVLVLAFALKLL